MQRGAERDGRCGHWPARPGGVAQSPAHAPLSGTMHPQAHVPRRLQGTRSSVIQARADAPGACAPPSRPTPASVASASLQSRNASGGVPAGCRAVWPHAEPADVVGRRKRNGTPSSVRPCPGTARRSRAGPAAPPCVSHRIAPASGLPETVPRTANSASSQARRATDRRRPAASCHADAVPASWSDRCRAGLMAGRCCGSEIPPPPSTRARTCCADPRSDRHASPHADARARWRGTRSIR